MTDSQELGELRRELLALRVVYAQAKLFFTQNLDSLEEFVFYANELNICIKEYEWVLKEMGVNTVIINNNQRDSE